jgi:hypothetical protein
MGRHHVTMPYAVRTALPCLIIPSVVVPSAREAGQGPAVGVERPTGRTTSTAGPWSAWLRLGRRRAG